MELTLFKIEDELRALVDMREQTLEDMSKGRGSDIENLSALERIETEIKAYLGAEVRKVDGIRAYYRMCEDMSAAARKESATLAERARAWEGRLDHLKSILASILGEMEWREGRPKKLEGRTGSIGLRGSGGLQPLNIYQPELLPKEFQKVTVEMNLEAWEAVSEAMAEWDATCPEEPPSFTARVISTAPDKDAIRRELEKPCDQCGGEGGGRIDGDNSPMVICGCCYGTGRASVPGARLEPRSQSVIIK